MNKKLPEVFHNSIDKKLNNNEDVYYSANNSNDEINKKEEKNNLNTKKSIRQKINEIFASPTYIYKASVKITTNDEIINKRIIGRNNKYLITMDNEKIPIENIIDIEIEKWAIRKRYNSFIIFIFKIIFFLICIVLICIL